MYRHIRLPGIRARLVALGLLSGFTAPCATAAAPTLSYDHSFRYRYELFTRDEDASTPPDAESKASTLRFALSGDAAISPAFGLFAEFEHVVQLGEDDYNIPTIPGQAIPGYPVIADPQGSELNQAYARIKGPLEAVVKIGRQEVMLNNGRFITTSGWRQNHQSFDGATLSLKPGRNWSFDYGYLSKVLRVAGAESTTGRAGMDSHFFNLKYAFDAAITLSLYGVLLDFDEEPANSTDSFGIRFDARKPLSERLSGLATLEYAQQRDAAGNPNEVDAGYLLVDAGLAWKGIAVRAAYNRLEGSSVTDKFNTPLAHPFNGWTELFLNTPSLGPDNHGLEAVSLSVGGPVAAIPGLKFQLVGYDYAPDTGPADYGRELDFQLDYAATRLHPNLAFTWRTGRYFAEALFSDALRTSVSAVFRF